MRVLGIAVSSGGGKPKIHGAIVSGTLSDPVLQGEFELKASDGDASEQAVDLARLLQGKLAGLEFDKAVIRTAGSSPVANRRRAQFSRAHAEGAAMFVLREHSKLPVATGDPAQFVKELPISKDQLTAMAKALSASKHDAAVAALSELPHD
jgi:Tfp pilus assembly PilM family ATPase